MKSKLYLLGITGMLLFTAACAKKPEPYKCLVSPNDPTQQCASEEWYSELQDLQALNKKYSPPADVQKQMKEKLALLQSTVPQGYDWNDQKKVFVKRAGPITQAPPNTAVPAAPAK
jgi:hypothetical protein